MHLRNNSDTFIDFILSRPSHGGNLVWAAALVNCSPNQITDFSASINPLGPPPSAIAAIQSHLGDLQHYPDPTYSNLRQALSQAHGVPPEWILPGNGAAELLTWACRELASLKQIHLLVPSFGDYFRSLSAFNAQFTTHSVDLSSHLKESSLRLEFSPSSLSGLLINTPHNPTGKLVSRADILAVLDEFALVVVDEAFMDFLPPQQQQSVIDHIADYPQLVVLRSLTKFYSIPGLRLGYAIAHPDRLRRWQQWRDPWSVNSLAAYAGVAVLHDQAFQQQTWDWLPSARAQLLEGLSGIPGLVPFTGVANFLLVQSEYSVAWLQRQLLEHDRILIRDCHSFPELGDRFFRVAVRTEADNQRLLSGLAAIVSDSLE